MELALGKKSIYCFKKIYDSTFTREETAESVVPDVMPDIAEILSVDGLVLLRSKEAEQGRVSLAGNVGATVLYLPEGGGGVKKLSLSVPFSASAESPVFSDKTRAVATVRLTLLEARMLNPRKVLVKAGVTVDLKCYEEGELEICDKVEDPSSAEILIRPMQCLVNPVTGVREKTFVITDEYVIPASKPIFGELLAQRVEFTVDDIKTVGNKLIFKGAAQVTLLYISEDGQDIASANYTTSFSQIIEMDGAYEQPDAEVRLMLTGAYFEPMPSSSEGRVISCELHMVAQASCSEKTELTYLSDAYSNNYDVELYRDSIELEGIERRMTVRETLRDLIETKNPVREVIDACAVTLTPDVRGKNVNCPVMIKLMYREDSGKICCTSKQYIVQATVELEPDSELCVTAVRAPEVYATGAAGGIDIRVPLDIDVVITSKLGLAPITGIELSEEPVSARSDRPSVTVVVPGNMDTWELAKRYRSTPELIDAANALEEGGVPGKVLLIPRWR